MEFVFAVLTLAFLEIVLGIDNIMFVSLVANRLPKEERNKTRIIGLLGAMIARIILLVLMVWLIEHLRKPFFPLAGYENVEEVIEMYKSEESILHKMQLLFHTIGVREIILFAGGLFLLTKSVSEIHHKMEGEAKEVEVKTKSFIGTVIEIMLVDIVFSFDSMLTAIGITENLPAMIIAVVVAVFVMIFASKKISDFMEMHPSLEVMGLSFLVLIGVMLVLDAVHYEVPRGYIYFAVFFSLAVELINMSIQKKKIKEAKPVELKKKLKDEIKD